MIAELRRDLDRLKTSTVGFGELILQCEALVVRIEEEIRALDGEEK